MSTFKRALAEPQQEFSTLYTTRFQEYGSLYLMLLPFHTYSLKNMQDDRACEADHGKTKL